MGGGRGLRVERNRNVGAWVKNDHLGFEIMYIYRGVVPDILTCNAHLLLLKGFVRAGARLRHHRR